MAKGNRTPPVELVSGILSYPHLIEPQQFEQEPGEAPRPPKYGCVVIVSEKNFNVNGGAPLSLEAVLAPLKANAAAARDSFFKGKAPRGLRSPFRKCEERWSEDDNGILVPEPGYPAGGIFIALDGGDRERPDCRDQAMKEVSDPRVLYAGCKVRAVVRASGYDRKGNKGVKFYLLTLQKIGEGDNIAGRVSAADYFKPVEVQEKNATTGASTGDGWTDGDEDDESF